MNKLAAITALILCGCASVTCRDDSALIESLRVELCSRSDASFIQIENGPLVYCGNRYKLRDK